MDGVSGRSKCFLEERMAPTGKVTVTETVYMDSETSKSIKWQRSLKAALLQEWRHGDARINQQIKRL